MITESIAQLIEAEILTTKNVRLRVALEQIMRLSKAVSDTRDDMLYEICPICNGSGKLPRDAQGVTRECYCKSLRVVAVGVTTGQLERMARRETIEAEQRAGYDRETGTLTPAAEPKP